MEIGADGPKQNALNSLDYATISHPFYAEFETKITKTHSDWKWKKSIFFSSLIEDLCSRSHKVRICLSIFSIHSFLFDGRLNFAVVCVRVFLPSFAVTRTSFYPFKINFRCVTFTQNELFVWVRFDGCDSTWFLFSSRRCLPHYTSARFKEEIFAAVFAPMSRLFKSIWRRRFLT